MSGEIQRWSMMAIEPEWDDQGNWVDYDDHASIVAAKDEEIHLGRAKYAAYRAEMVEELQNQANLILQKDEEIARLKFQKELHERALEILVEGIIEEESGDDATPEQIAQAVQLSLNSAHDEFEADLEQQLKERG